MPTSSTRSLPTKGLQAAGFLVPVAHLSEALWSPGTSLSPVIAFGSGLHMAETPSKVTLTKKEFTGCSQCKVQEEPCHQARLYPGAQRMLPGPCLSGLCPAWFSGGSLSLHVGKVAPGALALGVLASQRGESTVTQGRNLGVAYGGSAALGRSGCCAHLSQRGVPTHVNCADPPR